MARSSPSERSSAGWVNNPLHGFAKYVQVLSPAVLAFYSIALVLGITAGAGAKVDVVGDDNDDTENKQDDNILY